MEIVRERISRPNVEISRTYAISAVGQPIFIRLSRAQTPVKDSVAVDSCGQSAVAPMARFSRGSEAPRFADIERRRVDPAR